MRRIGCPAALRLFAKRLERNKFVWPPIVDRTLTLTLAQLASLIEAMDGFSIAQHQHIRRALPRECAQYRSNEQSHDRND